MVVLCVGDIHIKPTNLPLIDGLEVQLVEAVRRESVQCIVLLGDILDTFERLHTQALNRAYRLIDTLRAEAHVYVLVGNHDLINNQQFLTDQHWMNAMKDWHNVTIVDQVVTRSVTGMELVFVPYVPVQRFVEALESVGNAAWKHADYIFAHQEFQGCKMGAIQSVHGDAWAEDAPMIVSGHIHDYQRPQDNVLYIGASVQNNFGDQTDPRLLCIRGPRRNWIEIPVLLPKKKTVYATLDDVHELDPTVWVDDPAVDMVRIVVRGDYEQFKTFTKSTQYEHLVASQKCKVVHKPLPPVEPTTTTTTTTTTANPSHPEGVRDSAVEASFEYLVSRRVLERRDEWLYVAFEHVAYGDTSVSPDDLLIV
jgi:hypothetical protein